MEHLLKLQYPLKSQVRLAGQVVVRVEADTGLEVVIVVVVRVGVRS